VISTREQIVATSNRSDPIGPYDWDEAKRAGDLAAHGIDFSAVYDFDWDAATFAIDDREDYGLREIATGFIGESLHVVVYIVRDDRIRIVSLRRAENRDKKRYVEERR
jgi:uncharacterized protein